MNWDMAPECLSTVILCIIWIYSRKGYPSLSLKDRLFQVSFLFTFCAMASNILSAYLIYTLHPHTLAITWVVTLIYFVATPLMGMVYFLYAVANIYENDPHVYRYFGLSIVPGALYLGIVLLNPFTRSLFDLTVEGGYTQGKYIMTTYLVFYFYCLVCMLLVLLRGGRVPATIRVILFSFPVMAGLVIVIQLLAPHIVLSGSAATCALLLIYLYVQNKQLTMDHLTRIPNRQEFLRMLDAALKRKSEFSVLVVSLRQFKQMNDTYGQHNGDALLVAVSQFLRRDLALREGELYRFSGDEFALVLPTASESSIMPLVDRISARMAFPWEVGSCTCLLSAAMALVQYPNTAQELEGLINGIEYSVSQVKQGNFPQNYCFCTPALLEQARRRQTIAELLGQYLREDRFEMHYQPIWAVDSNTYPMAEALLRIPSSPLGPLSPAEFIPIAEESGLIVEITYAVLEKVCQCIRRQLDRGIRLDGINVNFSAVQFMQRDLIPRVTEIIQRCGIPFSYVKVELTEGTLAENPAVISDCIHQLHALGIRIGLDDFGTGYSNLASVLGLPIDVVKLDKSLVWAAIENERYAIMARHITSAFRALGITVLAEGVETDAQSRFVADCGCSLIQGFLYARPMPESEFSAFLRSHSAPAAPAAGSIS